jgi:N-6 DNA Methylase
MSQVKHPAWGAFIQLFNRIAPHRHRYDIFRDFVHMATAALHNKTVHSATLESEYTQIVGRYTKEEAVQFSHLLGELIILIAQEPKDTLGELYMSLDFGNSHTGQFFTPSSVSELMARLTYSDAFTTLETPFITVSEPACGAGGMVLAMVKTMLSHGHNPSETMWVQCQDIDRTAAFMCFIQLTVWQIPAVVIVGDTLANEVREALYTPAHYLGGWQDKLSRRRDDTSEADEVAESVATVGTTHTIATPTDRIDRPPVEAKMRTDATRTQPQFDFAF